MSSFEDFIKTWRGGYLVETDNDHSNAQYAAALAAWRAAQLKWQPIETAPHGKAVLAFYKNSLGKDRIIKAKYIEKHTEEACEDSICAEFFDYCEEKDEYFTPQGWYEIIDNGHEYSSYELEAGNNPTHWMPLPQSPEEQ